MTFKELESRFGGAIIRSFKLLPLFVASLVLVFCGLIALFFTSIAEGASYLNRLSLTFLPLFLCFGLLFSLGVFLIRLKGEQEQKVQSLARVFKESWELLLGSAYISGPLILGYLLIWLLLSVFSFISLIPLIGPLFSVLFSFVPFLLHLSTLLLGSIALLSLFYVTPLFARLGADLHAVYEELRKAFKSRFLELALSFVMAALPFYLLSILLQSAYALTFFEAGGKEHLLARFFVMVPYALILSWPAVFFFYFADGSMQKST